MRKILATIAGAAMLTAALAFAGPAQADGGNGDSDDYSKLSVLHAVKGLDVDVWLDGKRVINDFTPGTLAGPLDVREGRHTIVIAAADSSNPEDPIIGPVKVRLDDEKNYTAVAHLDADGKPKATLFTNDTKTAEDKGKLTVRHVAAAPAVDILAGGKAVIEDLNNPKEKVLSLKPGTVSAAVAAAGSTDPLIGPADVTVSKGKNTIVYAWGSLKDDNLALAVQVVDARDNGHDDD